jgi:cytochrome P450
MTHAGRTESIGWYPGAGVSGLLSDALYHLAANPAIEAKLIEEVDRVLGRDFSYQPRFQDIEQPASGRQIANPVSAAGSERSHRVEIGVVSLRALLTWKR